MLKRKIENRLLDWKKSKRNECLLVKGARQIGKTFSIRRFGKANYKSFVEINFEIRPELRSIFDGSLDVGEMLKRMLSVCREYGEEKVLLTCDQTNEASWRTIMKNGGKLENEVTDHVSKRVFQQ